MYECTSCSLPVGTEVHAVMRPRPWEAGGAATAARVARLAGAARASIPLLTLAANVQNPWEGASRRVSERRRLARKATEARGRPFPLGGVH